MANDGYPSNPLSIATYAVIGNAISTHSSKTIGAHGISVAGAALIDDETAEDQRTTLGLGNAATKTVDAANGVCGLDSGGKIPSGNLPSGIDVKVLADGADATPGYLSDKCDGTTLEVNTSTHVMRVKALGIADAQIATAAAIAWTKINKSGSAPGDVGAQASSSELTSLAGLSTVGILKRTGTGTHSILTSNTTGEDGLAGRITVATVTTDQTPGAADCGKIYENTGAGALVTLTLPSTPTTGTQFIAVCQNVNGIKFQCPASTTVTVGTTVSSSAGYTQSTAIGSSVTLVYIGSNKWVAIAVTGTWTTA
jgi:hypothetical protein